MVEFLLVIGPAVIGFGAFAATVKILERRDKALMPRFRAWLDSAPSPLVYGTYIAYWLSAGILLTVGGWLDWRFFGGRFDVTHWIVWSLGMGTMWAWIFNSNRKSAKFDDWLDWNLDARQ